MLVRSALKQHSNGTWSTLWLVPTEKSYKPQTLWDHLYVQSSYLLTWLVWIKISIFNEFLINCMVVSHSPPLSSFIIMRFWSGQLGITRALRAHNLHVPCVCITIQLGHMLPTTFTYTYIDASCRSSAWAESTCIMHSGHCRWAWLWWPTKMHYCWHL